LTWIGNFPSAVNVITYKLHIAGFEPLHCNELLPPVSDSSLKSTLEAPAQQLQWRQKGKKKRANGIKERISTKLWCSMQTSS